ncbi:hypothetical protein KIPB_004604 [Kipferlia bialata]|uniref:Uncharacterized protein n=1 Tax=Kipferlia bialata TaxID=797122 RepID=A0A9K3CVB2_9EUKA|nr:hypothetical protein KIPB_004604 [Kipferlia bialata]|eukprot:g4604.t1
MSVPPEILALKQRLERQEMETKQVIERARAMSSSIRPKAAAPTPAMPSAAEAQRRDTVYPPGPVEASPSAPVASLPVETAPPPYSSTKGDSDTRPVSVLSAEYDTRDRRELDRDGSESGLDLRFEVVGRRDTPYSLNPQPLDTPPPPTAQHPSEMGRMEREQESLPQLDLGRDETPEAEGERALALEDMLPQIPLSHSVTEVETAGAREKARARLRAWRDQEKELEGQRSFARRVAAAKKKRERQLVRLTTIFHSLESEELALRHSLAAMSHEGQSISDAKAQQHLSVIGQLNQSLSRAEAEAGAIERSIAEGEHEEADLCLKIDQLISDLERESQEILASISTKERELVHAESRVTHSTNTRETLRQERQQAEASADQTLTKARAEREAERETLAEVERERGEREAQAEAVLGDATAKLGGVEAELQQGRDRLASLQQRLGQVVTRAPRPGPLSGPDAVVDADNGLSTHVLNGQPLPALPIRQDRDRSPAALSACVDAQKAEVLAQTEAVAERQAELSAKEAEREKVRAEEEEQTKRLDSLSSSGLVVHGKTETIIQRLRQGEDDIRTRLTHIDEEREVLEQERAERETEHAKEVDALKERLSSLGQSLEEAEGERETIGARLSLRHGISQLPDRLSTHIQKLTEKIQEVEAQVQSMDTLMAEQRQADEDKSNALSDEASQAAERLAELQAYQADSRRFFSLLDAQRPRKVGANQSLLHLLEHLVTVSEAFVIRRNAVTAVKQFLQQRRQPLSLPLSEDVCKEVLAGLRERQQELQRTEAEAQARLSHLSQTDSISEADLAKGAERVRKQVSYPLSIVERIMPVLAEWAPCSTYIDERGLTVPASVEEEVSNIEQSEGRIKQLQQGVLLEVRDAASNISNRQTQHVDRYSSVSTDPGVVLKSYQLHRDCIAQAAEAAQQLQRVEREAGAVAQTAGEREGLYQAKRQELNTWLQGASERLATAKTQQSDLSNKHTVPQVLSPSSSSAHGMGTASPASPTPSGTNAPLSLESLATMSLDALSDEEDGEGAPKDDLLSSLSRSQSRLEASGEGISMLPEAQLQDRMALTAVSEVVESLTSEAKGVQRELDLCQAGHEELVSILTHRINRLQRERDSLLQIWSGNGGSPSEAAPSSASASGSGLSWEHGTQSQLESDHVEAYVVAMLGRDGTPSGTEARADTPKHLSHSQSLSLPGGVSVKDTLRERERQTQETQETQERIAALKAHAEALDTEVAQLTQALEEAQTQLTKATRHLLLLELHLYVAEVAALEAGIEASDAAVSTLTSSLSLCQGAVAQARADLASAQRRGGAAVDNQRARERDAQTRERQAVDALERVREQYREREREADREGEALAKAHSDIEDSLSDCKQRLRTIEAQLLPLRHRGEGDGDLAMPASGPAASILASLGHTRSVIAVRRARLSDRLKERAEVVHQMEAEHSRYAALRTDLQLSFVDRFGKVKQAGLKRCRALLSHVRASEFALQEAARLMGELGDRDGVMVPGLPPLEQGQLDRLIAELDSLSDTGPEMLEDKGAERHYRREREERESAHGSMSPRDMHESYEARSRSHTPTLPLVRDSHVPSPTMRSHSQLSHSLSMSPRGERERAVEREREREEVPSHPVPRPLTPEAAAAQAVSTPLSQRILALIQGVMEDEGDEGVC